MLKTLTKKLRRHSLNDIHPFQLKISYHGSGEAEESDDSEGENQELAQIDRERRRICTLTPLATSQQHNQGPPSPARPRRLRLLLEAGPDLHSSEEELERIGGVDGGRRAFPRLHADRHSGASSDEEVRDLCRRGSPAESSSSGPVLFSSSPPRGLGPRPRPATRHAFFGYSDQAAPYRRRRHGCGGEPERPSLDLEKMRQKMLLKKNCGGKTRTLKIRTVSGMRPPPRSTCDPSAFSFCSLNMVPLPQEPQLTEGERV